MLKEQNGRVKKDIQENYIKAKKIGNNSETSKELKTILDTAEHLKKIDKIKEQFSYMMQLRKLTKGDKNAENFIKDTLNEFRKKVNKFLKKGKMIIRYRKGITFDVNKVKHMKMENQYNNLRFKPGGKPEITLENLENRITYNKKNGTITLYMKNYSRKG